MTRTPISRSLVVVSLALATVAANCEQCEKPTDLRKGNLDRAGDVVLVTRTFDDIAHTFAVVSNPELEHLRVFNATVESFADAPNGYFPLSIPVGPDTRKLTVADDGTVFALDAATDRVFVVDTTAGEGATAVEPGFFVRAVFQTRRAPADIAVVGRGEDLEVWLTLPDTGFVQVLDGVGDELAHVRLGDGGADVQARPTDIVVDPQGESVVVGDAAQGVLHVFSRGADPFAVARTVDVGAGVGGLAAGVVDIGDGLAPVVLVLLRDQPVATLVRLFRPGVPEERYAVLGSAELPGRPLSAYVPDNRETATVCCRELSGDAVDAGQATDAWAAVGTADGKIIYLSLLAVDGLVRIFDNNLEGLAEGEPRADDWVPVVGDEEREPDATVTGTGVFGDPPFVPLVDEDEELTLVWEDALPGLLRLRGEFSGGTSEFVANTNLEARGAAPGQLALIALEEAEPGCPDEVAAVVDSVQETRVRITLDDADEELCLTGAGDLRISLAPNDAFVARDRDGDFLGTIALGGELTLPGAVLTLTEGAGGAPQQRGSALIVPINAHVAVIDLDLADAVSFLASDGGGLGRGAQLPVAIVGGEMNMPGVELGSIITARRMLIASGANEVSGLNMLVACDEGETIPGLCQPFR